MKNYTITKDQLRKITDPQVKEWFPDAFEFKFKKGDWIKFDNNNLICISDYENKEGFGFYSTKVWFDNINNLSFKCFPERWTSATEEEVFEALKNEAIKRGFKVGTCFNFRKYTEVCEGEI